MAGNCSLRNQLMLVFSIYGQYYGAHNKKILHIILEYRLLFEHSFFFSKYIPIKLVITSAISSHILTLMSRQKLIFFVSFIPLIGHSIIYFDQDCSIESGPTFINEAILILGFIFYGMGIGTYYSISFPAVGLSVPQ